MKLLLIDIFMSHVSKNFYPWAHTIKLEHNNNNPERSTIRRNGEDRKYYLKVSNKKMWKKSARTSVKAMVFCV